MQAHKVFTDSGVACGEAAGIHTLSRGREVRDRKKTRVQPEANKSPWGPVCSPFCRLALGPPSSPREKEGTAGAMHLEIQGHLGHLSGV